MTGGDMSKHKAEKRQDRPPSPGRALVIHNRKGGVGKSTLATHLAIYLQREGRAVFLLDLDARQADSFDFFEGRKNRYPGLPVLPVFEPTTAEEVTSYIEKAKSIGADIVIDCPPADSDLALAAVDAADALVTPFKAGGNDARAVGRVLRMIAQPNMATPPHLAHIKEIKPRMIDDRNLYSLLNSAGIFKFCGVLGQRKEFKQTAAQCLAVWELSPGSQAAEEAELVCGTIDRYLQ